MSIPYVLSRDALRVSQTEVVLAPVRDMGVVKRLKRRRSPCGRMHSVGNRIDVIAGKHQARHLAMFFSDAIDVTTHVESEVSHVEHGLRCRRYLAFRSRFMPAEYAHGDLRFADVRKVLAKTER